MRITWLAVREKLRKKYLYIVAGISVLLVCLFGGGNGNLTVDGRKITEFSTLLPYFLGFVNIIGGMLAIAISVSTIPKEYERCTHHLILIRGISSKKFHWQLALANVIVSSMVLAVLYLGIGLFCLEKGEIANQIYMTPAYLIGCLYVAMISMLASILSIVMPVTIAGMLSAAMYLIGISYPLIVMLKGMVEGVSHALFTGFLKVIPNLIQIQGQTARVLLGKRPEWHSLLVAVVILYIECGLLYVARRRENQE